MQGADTRNLILAIALSLLVWVGWEYFFGKPAQPPQQPAQQTEATGSAPVAPIAAPPAKPVTREEALAGSGARIAIATPKLGGSIRVQGARIDDLILHGYRETADPKSPEIVLFEPAGAQHPYYAEFGWTAAQGAAGALPSAETAWRTDQAELAPGKPVTLSYDNGAGLVFTRTINVDERYMFTVTDAVQNNSAAPVTLYPFGLVSRHGLPTTPHVWVLHEGPIGVIGGALYNDNYDDLREASPAISQTTGGWLGITDKYWMAALIPDQSVPVRTSFADKNEAAGEIVQADYIYSTAQTVAPGAAATVTHRLFAGAKVVSTIYDYRDQLGIARFDLAIDWGWFWFFTKPIFFALDWLYALVGNFGVGILLLTVLVKLIFFPLANKSYAAMTKMKKIQPEMQALRERYKDNAVEQQQQIMALYKREKANPLAGCLPIFIQIPVFFSLYKVLYVTIEMRHAPFFGWIQDLSTPDPTNLFNLFGLLPFAPPSWLHIGLWPIVMGLTMWAQQKMNPPATDPTQQRVFALMPWFFTYLLASFPAGLVIYWTWNNLLSILQQSVIMRRMGVKVDWIGNVKWLRRLRDRARAGP